MTLRPTADQRAEAEATYELWLYGLFRSAMSTVTGRLVGLAPQHRDFWEWVQTVRPGAYVPPVVNVWARGAAKSTHGELAVVYLGATRRRKYALYVSDKQERADDHVGNIAGRIESPIFGTWYPEMRPRVGKYGNRRGWRRNRIRTANGFTVDALGLDVAVRGVRLDDDRPDLIVFDDIDDVHDSALTVERKLRTIARSVMPSMSSDGTAMFLQNLIHRFSVASHLATTDPEDDLYTDVMADRLVLGPTPALVGGKTGGVRRAMHVCAQLDHAPCADDGKIAIVGVHRGVHRCAERHPEAPCERDGRPAWLIDDGIEATWEGQDQDQCEQMIASMGLEAFVAECQHDIGLTGNLVFVPPFDPQLHAWRRKLPPFLALFGGLDFGGQRPDAHFSAGLLGGLTSTRRLIRVAEFHDRGPGVIDRQIAWMRDQERRWARPLRQRVHWRGDGSQPALCALLAQMPVARDNPNAARFLVATSDRSPGSVGTRISLVTRRMAVQETGEPASFYLPAGVPKWAKQVQEVAWKPLEPGDANVPREPVKRNDDLTDCDLYLHEEADLYRPGRHGRAVRQRGGGKRATAAV